MPTVSWVREGGALPAGRAALQSHDTELRLTDVRHSDRGQYLCRADSEAGHAEATLDLIVHGLLFSA